MKTEVPGVGARTGGVEAVWPGGLRAAVTLGDVLAEGGDARIHAVDGRDDVVAKMYRVAGTERRAKLDAMLAAPPEGHASTFDGRTYVQFAWPVARLEEGPLRGLPPGAATEGTTTGFLMPRVDLEHAALLEMLLTGRARQAARLPEGLRARVTAAHNLAAAVAGLHAAGHYVVDLKPANVHVYRETQFVAVLDCDGFSVAGPGGVRFPAHQFTEGYIAPEGMLLRPEELGEAQDRFALAVVLFQLLNRGLHPFQGVPRPGSRVPTTDAERVAARLYPYGPGGARDLAPPPQSRYAYFDARTRALFDAAFDGPAERRPSAALWRDSLRALLVERLHACENDPDHARFGDEPCGACALDTERTLASARAASPLSAGPGSPPGTSAGTPASVPSPPAPGTTGSAWQALMWGVAILLVVLALGAIFTGLDDGYGPDTVPVVEMGGAPDTYEVRRLLAAINEGRVYVARQALAGGAEMGGTDAVANDATGPGGMAPYAPIREPGAEAETGCRPPSPVDSTFEPSMLRLAAERGHVSMVSLLLTSGAPPTGFDRTRGITALMAAAGQCTLVADPNADAIAALLEAVAMPAEIEMDAERRLTSDAVSRHPELRALLGADSTPVHAVERLGALVANVAVLRTLLAALGPLGAIDAADAWGRTALDYAAAAGNAAAVRLLLEAGADPNIQDAAGTVPLMIAADRATSPATDRAAAAVVYELVEGGANRAMNTYARGTAADYVGERPATTAARLRARPDSAAVEFPDGLPRSATRALLLSDARGAALVAAGRRPARVDRTASVDIGDGGTTLDPAIVRRPMPSDARRPPPSVEVECPGTETPSVARVTYGRTGTAGWGRVMRVSVDGWLLDPAVLDPDSRTATVERVAEELARQRCVAEIRNRLGQRVSLAAEPERWPVHDVALLTRVRSSPPVGPSPPQSMPPPPPPPPDPSDPLDFAEVSPELIGGIERLQAGIDYPESARRSGVEGRVIVRFTVTRRGQTTNVTVARSVSPVLDLAAVRAVQRARFTPGRQNGAPVEVRMTLPVTFRIR